MSSVELSRSSDSNLSSSLFTCRIFKSRSSRKFTTRFFLERHGQGARDALTCASYSINLRRAARSRWAVGGQFSGFLKIIQRFYQIHKFWACESSRCTSGCSGPSHGKNDPGGGVESERLTFGQRGPSCSFLVFGRFDNLAPESTLFTGAGLDATSPQYALLGSPELHLDVVHAGYPALKSRFASQASQVRKAKPQHIIIWRIPRQPVTQPGLSESA
jgi:hypothetical protein